MDAAAIVLASAVLAGAVVLAVVVGTLTARLFFHATRGESDEASEPKHEAIR